jgi:hypothetical protein
VSTCHADKANGEPCQAQAVTGTDYCRHHQPEGGAEDDPEQVALDTLTDLAQSARSEKTQVRAAGVILEHVREQ